MEPPPARPQRADAPETVAVVLLRDPGDGKTRLAPLLGRADRAALVTAMFRDVVHVLEQSPVNRVVVAAGGERAVALARDEDLDVVRDAFPGDLNRAVEDVARHYSEAETLLTVVADLPCLRPDEVGRLLGVAADVVVAPTADGGTGGLVRRPASVVPTAYGPVSARRHLALARERGLETASVVLPGFQRDVDTPADLADLLDQPVGPATSRVLALLGDRVSADLEATPPRRRS